MDIKLDTFEESDIPLLKSWLTDDDLVFIWTGHRFTYPLNEDEFKTFMEEPKQEHTRGYLFKVVDSEKNVPFGYIELNPINAFCNSVNICRVLIGDVQYRGLGLAKAMVNEVLKVAFIKEKLHRVELTVNFDNEKAIRAYESVGFKKEVRLRKYLKYKNSFNDIFIMSILEHEWRSLNETAES